jgi:hypothetical protein
MGDHPTSLWINDSEPEPVAKADGTPQESDAATYEWIDESGAIWVGYRHDKAIAKQMFIRVPSWKLKVREWERLLRGLPVWYSGRENSW